MKQKQSHRIKRRLMKLLKWRAFDAVVLSNVVGHFSKSGRGSEGLFNFIS